MTQKQRLRDYLESGQPLRRLDAWDKLGIIEAPARITELRQEGMDIATTMITVTNRYGEKVRIAEWRMINDA